MADEQQLIRHSHSGLNQDGDRISYRHLKDVPSVSFKYAMATISSNQSIDSWSSEEIVWDWYTTNDTGMTGTNWRIIITQAWIYNITGIVVWWTAITAAIIKAQLLKNAGWVTYFSCESWTQASNTVSHTMSLAKDDYLTLEAFQNSGWGEALDGTRTFFAVSYLGAAA